MENMLEEFHLRLETSFCFLNSPVDSMVDFNGKKTMIWMNDNLHKYVNKSYFDVGSVSSSEVRDM